MACTPPIGDYRSSRLCTSRDRYPPGCDPMNNREERREQLALEEIRSYKEKRAGGEKENDNRKQSIKGNQCEDHRDSSQK